MLRLSLPKIDVWDEKTEEFKEIGGYEVEFEHSLYTIAGWEAKWKVPFARPSKERGKGMTQAQLMDYITNFMCQTPNVPRSAWLTINQDLLNKINAYMEDPHTATTIKKPQTAAKGSREIVTSELLYFYMTQFNIPPQYEHWHLNRLMTLLDVCSVKNTPPKKMGKKEAARMRASQNAAMRKKLGSRG